MVEPAKNVENTANLNNYLSLINNKAIDVTNAIKSTSDNPKPFQNNINFHQNSEIDQANLFFSENSETTKTNLSFPDISETDQTYSFVPENSEIDVTFMGDA